MVGLGLNTLSSIRRVNYRKWSELLVSFSNVLKLRNYNDCLSYTLKLYSWMSVALSKSMVDCFSK